MTALFRASITAMSQDIQEITASIKDSMRGLTESLRKLDEGGGKL